MSNDQKKIAVKKAKEEMKSAKIAVREAKKNVTLASKAKTSGVLTLARKALKAAEARATKAENVLEDLAA